MDAMSHAHRVIRRAAIACERLLCSAAAAPLSIYVGRTACGRSVFVATLAYGAGSTIVSPRVRSLRNDQEYLRRSRLDM